MRVRSLKNLGKFSSHLKNGQGRLVTSKEGLMCLGFPRTRDLVPPPGTILLWGEGIPFSCLLPPLPPVARVIGKTLGSAQIVTTLTGVTFDYVVAYLFYVYPALF